MKFKNFIGCLWFSKNATGKRNDLTIQIFGSKGSIHWEHKNSEEIYLFDNNGNKKVINRLTSDTMYLKNKKFFTYSPGHPSGFLDGFINIYEKIYLLYKKKIMRPSIFLNLKDNLNIISTLNAIHNSSIKKKWLKVNLKK